MGAQTDIDRRWLTPLPLWTGILAGPVAWALDLTISYAIVKWTCASRRTFVMHAITPAALTLIVGGGVLSWLAYVHTAGDGPTDGGRPRQRARFMALLGIASSTLFALAILAGAVPRWVLDACE